MQQVSPSGLFVMDTTWPHVSSPFLLEKIDFTVFLITVVVARSHLWQIQWVHMASPYEDLQAQVQKTFLMWFLMEKWCLLKKMNSRKSCDRTHADQRYWRLSQWVTVSITRVSLQSSVIKPRIKDREFDADDYTVTVQSHQRKQRTIQRQRSIKIKNDYSTGLVPQRRRLLTFLPQDDHSQWTLPSFDWEI